MMTKPKKTYRASNSKLCGTPTAPNLRKGKRDLCRHFNVRTMEGLLGRCWDCDALVERANSDSVIYFDMEWEPWARRLSFCASKNKKPTGA